MNLEEQIVADVFSEGYNDGYIQCKSDLTEFIRANPKITVEQIIKHLEELK